FFGVFLHGNLFDIRQIRHIYSQLLLQKYKEKQSQQFKYSGNRCNDGTPRNPYSPLAWESI
ncbi:MAG: hypothetical protein KUG80_05055, partial [Gammaproteobacteria bacterium]|nr:hypothetical protein [Gammaproteobacteria bacterium]